jgi:large repetitive protein
VTLGSNGTLAGTPAFGSAGTYPFTITATDANSSTSTQAFTLTVGASAPVFTSAASISFAEGSAGTFAITANGDAPISYSETGDLPSGVSLATNGTLSGTPDAGTAGTYPISITATDANTNTSTQAFTLTVASSVPVFTSTGSTTFAENTAGTFSVTATGDTPISYSEVGALPTGVSLAADGTLAGTPAFGSAGSYPFTITATDVNTNTSTQSFTLTVTATAPVFTSGASTTFAESTAGTFSVTATGDTPISYSEVGALPTGVSLAANGTLAGTPASGSAGTYPITITATDAHAATSTQSFTLTVGATGPAFTSGTSTTFAENTAGTFSVTATGDTPISFSEVGTLPSGVTLGSNGTLAGTPAFGSAGTYPFSITATDANSNTSAQAFSLTVTTSGPAFTSAASKTFTENTAGTFAVTANGDGTISYTKTGALPTGVSLASNGTLAGTPAFGTAGTYPVSITATDANAKTATQSFTLTVTASGPVFTSAASTSFAETHAGTFSATANGDGSITYSETGSLPSGVTLASNGTLAGTPAFGTAGTYPVSIKATDANATTATQSFTLTVTSSAPVFTSATSTTFTATSAGTFSVTANGDTPITFTETGSLPSGVTLASNGTLAGTPASGTAGTYPITLKATDVHTNASTQAFTLTVGNTPPSTAVIVPSNNATVSGTTSSLDASASAATGLTISKVQFTLTGGTYNKTLIGTATASIYGYVYSWNTTGVPNGTYTLQSLATDSAANTAYSAGITVTVSNAPPTTAVIVPSNNATVSGSTSSLDASASAASGLTVSKVQFTLTGGTYNKTLIGTATASIYGYLYSWNTLSVPNGTYTLQSLATDSAGNTAYSAGITVTVSNTPPTTAVIVPSNNATVSGTASALDASASAATGLTVSKVQFTLTGGTYNKTVIGTATASIYGYVYSWNTTGVVNGTYTLQSLATDSAGNTTYSAGITVKVSN